MSVARFVMKIGQLVKRNLRKIFLHCDQVDHDEIFSLLDPAYSKQTFDTNFPFCIEIAQLEPSQSKRYWTDIYLVRGRQVRVTSQWFEPSRLLFLKYLESKGIEIDAEEMTLAAVDAVPKRKSPSKRANSRYRGNAIGNAQNLLIRNILSSLGARGIAHCFVSIVLDK